MTTLTSLFDWMLTASFRASVLTLLVLAAQFLLGRRISARTRYAFWLPVLVVLLMPVLPQSRWSVGSLFAAGPVQAPAPALMMTGPDTGSEQAMVTKLSLSAHSEPAAPIWPWLWLGISSAILLGVSLSYGIALRRYRRAQSKGDGDHWSALLVETAREVGLSRPPRVWHTKLVQSPAVTGLWRPVLLLPESFEHKFSDTEMRLILQHELMHLKRLDLPLNALACLLLALHWFNPLLWLAFLKARADCEAACDAQVLENSPRSRRVEYGHALLKAETAFAPMRFSLGFLGIFQRGASLRARIQSIAIQPKSHPVMKLITLSCITLLTFFGITSRAEDKQSTTKDQVITYSGGTLIVKGEQPSFTLGESKFREGDSIRITQVRRVGDALTVAADYDLASADSASIMLSITTNENGGRSSVAPTQRQLITKGKGTVLLHHPSAPNGKPHVSFYAAEGGSSFGGVYFGAAGETSIAKASPSTLSEGKNPLEEKLKSIIFPSVEFSSATVEEAIDFIRIKSRDYDTSESDSSKKGVNIIVTRMDPPNRAQLTMSLKNVPMKELLNYVTELANLTFRVEPFAVVITPQSSKK